MKNKIIIFGDNYENIVKLLNKNNMEMVSRNPDFIISFGGDGTLMQAEEKYPEVPKIILRNSRICKLCSTLENSEVLKKIKNKEYRIENVPKLFARHKNKKLVAINDITVHNGDPRRAIRYRFSINDKWSEHEIIGDGIVMATPLGSTGYYRSITDSFFETGIGLAFNNSTEQSDHMVLKNDSKIEIEITRGPAIVFADNQKTKITLNVGDKVTLGVYEKTAQLVRLS